MSTRSTIEDRFRATILGAAVADALSFPYRDYSRRFLQSLARSVTEEYERDTSGFFPAGQISADTQSLVAVMRSVLEAGEVRRSTVAEYLIPLWRDFQIVRPSESCSEAVRLLVKGIAEPEASGLEEGRAESGALSRAIAIGLWNVGRPRDVPADIDAAIRVTHHDPRVLGAAAGVAAWIASELGAEELILGSLLDDVHGAVACFHDPLAEAILDVPRIISQTDRRAWSLIEKVCVDERYPPRDDGIGEYVVPTFLMAVYYSLKCPGQFEEAISRCVRMGGRSSTLSTVTGAIVAGQSGLEDLPEQLISRLVDRTEIVEVANEYYEAWRLRRFDGSGGAGPDVSPATDSRTGRPDDREASGDRAR